MGTQGTTPGLIEDARARANASGREQVIYTAWGETAILAWSEYRRRGYPGRWLVTVPPSDAARRAQTAAYAAAGSPLGSAPRGWETTD